MTRTAAQPANERCAETQRHLDDVHGRIAKGLGILVHFSKPGRIAAHQEQLCILVLRHVMHIDY